MRTLRYFLSWFIPFIYALGPFSLFVLLIYFFIWCLFLIKIDPLTYVVDLHTDHEKVIQIWFYYLYYKDVLYIYWMHRWYGKFYLIRLWRIFIVIVIFFTDLVPNSYAYCKCILSKKKRKFKFMFKVWRVVMRLVKPYIIIKCLVFLYEKQMLPPRLFDIRFYFKINLVYFMQSLRLELLLIKIFDLFLVNIPVLSYFNFFGF